MLGLYTFQGPKQHETSCWKQVRTKSTFGADEELLEVIACVVFAQCLETVHHSTIW